MTDELQNIYLPKFDDNDEMYFDDDEIYLEAIA